MRGARPATTKFMAIAVAASALLVGCVAPGVDSPIAHDRATASEARRDGLVDLLTFANWARTASPQQLHRRRFELEYAARTGTDTISRIRLSLVLHALRSPAAHSEQARELLVQFIDDPATAEHEDVRVLAAFLLGSWDEQAQQRRARLAAEEQARRERAAHADERRLRTRAEQRLDALINVEQRARRGRDAGAEIKPVSP